MKMDYKRIAEFGVNMNAKTMVSLAQRGAWSDVEQVRRISDSMLRAYEKVIGAIRL